MNTCIHVFSIQKRLITSNPNPDERAIKLYLFNYPDFCNCISLFPAFFFLYARACACMTMYISRLSMARKDRRKVTDSILHTSRCRCDRTINSNALSMSRSKTCFMDQIEILFPEILYYQTYIPHIYV